MLVTGVMCSPTYNDGDATAHQFQVRISLRFNIRPCLPNSHSMAKAAMPNDTYELVDDVFKIQHHGSKRLEARSVFNPLTSHVDNRTDDGRVHS